MELGGQTVKAGSWLVKIEVKDDAVWNKIQNGDITGVSIGGMACYGTDDVSLEGEETVEKQEKRGLLATIAKAMGFATEAQAIEKGAVRDLWNMKIQSEGFWAAYDTLREVLQTRYVSYVTGGVYNERNKFEHDPQKVYDALKDFCEIVTELLVERPEAVAEAIAQDNEREVAKAGRKLSAARMQQLTAAAEQLNKLIAEVSGEPEQEKTDEEESSMTEQEMDRLAEKLATCLKPQEPTKKSEKFTVPTTKEGFDALVAESVKKAMGEVEEQEDNPISNPSAELQEMVDKAIKDAVRGLRGTASTLNDETPNVKKSADPFGWNNLLHIR